MGPEPKSWGLGSRSTCNFHLCKYNTHWYKYIDNDNFHQHFFLSVCLQVDIGMIYDEPQHSLLNKWLLLADPDDSMAGAKGYLKVCVSVIGAGDEPPVWDLEILSLFFFYKSWILLFGGIDGGQDLIGIEIWGVGLNGDASLEWMKSAPIKVFS